MTWKSKLCRTTALLLCIFPGLLVHAQAGSSSTVYQTPIAYVGPDGNVYVTGFGSTTSTQVTKDGTVSSHFGNQSVDQYGGGVPVHQYTGIRWSLDGSAFSFEDVFNSKLYVMRSGQIPVEIAGVKTGNRWQSTLSPDGSQIAYITPDFALNVVSLSSGQNKKIGGVYEMTVERPKAGDAEVLWTDNYNYTPFDSAYLILWTPYGILHCEDSLVEMLSPDGKIVWTSDGGIGDAQGFVASPDRKKAALATLRSVDNAATGSSSMQDIIVIFDLATGKTTELGSLPGAMPLAWSKDAKTIFFRTKSDTVSVQDKNDPEANLVGNTNEESMLNLLKTSVEGRDPVQVFHRRGYDLSPAFLSPDESTLIFGFVTSSVPAIKASNAGASAEAVKKIGRAQQEILKLSLRHSDTAAIIAPGGQFDMGTQAFIIPGGLAQ